MSTPPIARQAAPHVPRFITIAGHPVNSYKVFLCVGIYVGALATAVKANASGLSPLLVGLSATVSALAGLIGARVYHLVVHAPLYFRSGSPRASSWDRTAGGLSVFGALLTFVPVSYAAAAVVHIPAAVLWDQMAIGVLAGGFWIRLGCVLNGCCVGRATDTALGVRLHDTAGLVKRRIPVQFLEMAWWILGLVVFTGPWPRAIPAGSAALAVLAWYGAGRFFLEPLRETPDLVCGRLRINQVVAALIAVGAGGALILIIWG
jgi:phosphatidylglycerol---prolipoprotein diacylglyceryl transferase